MNNPRPQWDEIDPSKIANFCSARHVQSVIEDAKETIGDMRKALESAEKALTAISDEMTVGERYTNAGQHLLDVLPLVREAVTKARGG